MASSFKKMLGIVKPASSNSSSNDEISVSTKDMKNTSHPRDSSQSSTANVGVSSADENGLKSKRMSMTGSLYTNSSPRNSGIFGRFRASSVDSNSHGHTKSPIRAVKERFGLAGDSGDESDSPFNRDGEKMSKNQLRKAEKQAEKENRLHLAGERKKAFAQKMERIEKEAAQKETAAQRERYGILPPNIYSGKVFNFQYTKFAEISEKHVGTEVVFRARIHAMRKVSNRLAFVLFRQNTRTIQGVLQTSEDVSKFFVFWAERRMEIESVVLVKGLIQEPQTKEGEVTGATIHDWELLIKDLHVQGNVTAGHLPFTVHEAELLPTLAEKDEGHQTISQRVRMVNRVIDLRSSASQSIFRIQSGITFFFRQYLDSKGFIEIHTPKLQGGATESGASVFKVDYFGRNAFLAQSPQLAKQMSIAGDFGRVYEIGAVFRAENSNTHRHLTEYTGLDIEMAIDEHYHEVLHVLDETFKHIFKGLYERHRHEIDKVKETFPHEDLVWLEKTPIIPFAEGIRLLNESGWRDDNGNPLPEDQDMGTRDEIQLGKVIKEKYKTDYYVLDKFPVGARPFYAMVDQNNPKLSNGFDIFLRGQEILSGGQRVHDAPMLIERLEQAKIDRASMEDYIQGFEWGAPPHGGGGIGLERMLMLFLNLGDIRNASLFYRDPKSFPAEKQTSVLRHPEASTVHPPWLGKDRVLSGLELQPLEKLIANYGDASNTSWLEPRTEIWRDQQTGAAVGYTPQDGYAIIVGNPLCDSDQYTKTIAGFLNFLKKDIGLKPMWLLVGQEMEEVLATRFNWRSFSVVAEQRVNPTENPAAQNSDLQKKVAKAQKEGIKIHDITNGKEVPQDIREKIDHRVNDWLANRKGKQVHLTNIRPWQDMEHRQYHYATDKEGKVAALVVLAMLSPQYGWQIKFSLDFPGAPNGAIEYLIMHALKQLGAGGVTSATFGGGAMPTFTPGHNMKGAKVKVLSKVYGEIVTRFKLTNKSEFREKLGATEDPVYICYPSHGLGPSAVRAILNFFED